MRSWLLSLGLLWCLAAVDARALAAKCGPVTVGVDTSQGNTWLNVYGGSAFGQVFEARGLTLLALSVWREPGVNNTPLRVYVLEVDSTGRPDFNRILRRGPTLSIVYGDSVRPVRFRFEFDPPVVLPGPGRYGFAVQVAPDPVCDGQTQLLGNDLNIYAEGRAWLHPRSYPLPDCPLLRATSVDPEIDMIFELEFCDEKTPAHRSSWGGLKTRYR